MPNSELLYWIAAIAGSIFFILKVASACLGGLLDTDFSDDHDSDQAFKIFSIHSMTGFFMLFGWAGLACLKQYELSDTLSFLIAFVAGCLMLLITHLIFKGATTLVSHGDQFTLEDAIGLEAVVYQRIGSDKEGRVQCMIGGMIREFRAVSKYKMEIPSFSTVEIIGIVDQKILIVKNK